MDAESSLIFGINAILEKLKASPDEILEILVAGDTAAHAIHSEAARTGVRQARVARPICAGTAPSRSRGPGGSLSLLVFRRIARAVRFFLAAARADPGRYHRPAKLWRPATLRRSGGSASRRDS